MGILKSIILFQKAYESRNPKKTIRISKRKVF